MRAFLVFILLFFYMPTAHAADIKQNESLTKIIYNLSVKGNPIVELVAALKLFKKVYWEESILTGISGRKRKIEVKNDSRILMNLSSDSEEESFIDIRGNKSKEEAVLSEENIIVSFRLLDFVRRSNGGQSNRQIFVFKDKTGESEKKIILSQGPEVQDLRKISGLYKNGASKAEFKVIVADSGPEKGSVVGAEFKFKKWLMTITLVLDRIYFNKDGVEIIKEEPEDTEDQGGGEYFQEHFLFGSL